MRGGYHQRIASALVAVLLRPSGCRARGFTVTDAAQNDPAGQVDALVTAIGPGLDAPAVNLRDVVLVTGPWLAGVSGVVAALRERVPQHKFVESTDMGSGDAPIAVVFVVSAAAGLTESDCALLDAAAEHTDAVIGVVSKIDVHRAWCDVLDGNRDKLARYAPRYRRVPWVGVAALPDLGEPRVDELVGAVETQLAGSDIARRNRLRAWDSRLQKTAERFDRDAAGAGRRAGLRHCANSAARPCGSGASRNPSTPSCCAARSSRPGSSCRTSHATAVRRCVVSCKRTPRAYLGATCPASRRIPAPG